MGNSPVQVSGDGCHARSVWQAAYLESQESEDKGLTDECSKLKETPQGDLRVPLHAVVGVVRVADAREEQRHNPAQLQHLHPASCLRTRSADTGSHRCIACPDCL